MKQPSPARKGRPVLTVWTNTSRCMPAATAMRAPHSQAAGIHLVVVEGGNRDASGGNTGVPAGRRDAQGRYRARGT